ncbi:MULTISPECIES: hypothetical protein [unclassified Kitasatospora]|uniref:hypothetical protein n=1 Tax=unclassified Kitasatospora TaxID=2633591 RepID=UPI0033E47096
MTSAAHRSDSSAGIVIRFDVGKARRYVGAECQLDAHWACPGGIREVSGAVALVCLCVEPSCACARHLSGSGQ